MRGGGAYKSTGITNRCYGSLATTDDTRKGCCEKYPTSILRFAKPHPSVSQHPTEKPVALLEYLIKTYSNEGDVVLDNCMGSGSTGVACLNTGRRFIGIEIDAVFFEIARERIMKPPKSCESLRMSGMFD